MQACFILCDASIKLTIITTVYSVALLPWIDLFHLLFLAWQTANLQGTTLLEIVPAKIATVGKSKCLPIRLPCTLIPFWGVGVGAVDKDIFERAGGHNKPSKSKNILGNNVLVFTSTLLSKSLSRGLQILRLLHNTKYES